MTGTIEDPALRENYIFAGKAVFTLVSERTGKRFTYRVVRENEEKPFWVFVLDGPDNVSDYQYIGCVMESSLHILRAGHRGNADAPSFKALAWFLEHLGTHQAQLFHKGKCGRCGRDLTVPQSIRSGLGPVCATL